MESKTLALIGLILSVTGFTLSCVAIYLRTVMNKNTQHSSDEAGDYDAAKLKMLIEDEAGHFHRTEPLSGKFNWKSKCKITLTGSVLNGILFHEENDAVIHYTLEGNIPPNGDYIVTGIFNSKTLSVTSFKSVEII